MRWQSNGSVVALRRLSTTGRPMVRLGTKWLSITSTCSQSAAPSTARASSARCAKSAARMLGATIRDDATTPSVYGPALAAAYHREEHRVGTVPVRPQLHGPAGTEIGQVSRQQRPCVDKIDIVRAAPARLGHAHVGLHEVR